MQCNNFGSVPPEKHLIHELLFITINIELFSDVLSLSHLTIKYQIIQTL